MMFLDVPFIRKKLNTEEYLTLTVAKSKTDKRQNLYQSLSQIM